MEWQVHGPREAMLRYHPKGCYSWTGSVIFLESLGFLIHKGGMEILLPSLMTHDLRHGLWLVSHLVPWMSGPLKQQGDSGWMCTAFSSAGGPPPTPPLQSSLKDTCCGDLALVSMVPGRHCQCSSPGLMRVTKAPCLFLGAYNFLDCFTPVLHQPKTGKHSAHGIGNDFWWFTNMKMCWITPLFSQPRHSLRLVLLCHEPLSHWSPLFQHRGGLKFRAISWRQYCKRVKSSGTGLLS